MSIINSTSMDRAAKIKALRKFPNIRLMKEGSRSGKNIDNTVFSYYLSGPNVNDGYKGMDETSTGDVTTHFPAIYSKKGLKLALGTFNIFFDIFRCRLNILLFDAIRYTSIHSYQTNITN